MATENHSGYRNEFAGKGYGEFKLAVGESVVELLVQLGEAEDLMKNKDYLTQVYRDGAEKASRTAARTLRKVHKKLSVL